MRELSPRELTQACLERAEQLEPDLKAFVTIDSEGALARAAELSDELTRSGPRSALHGIPIGIKDLIDVEGLPNTASSGVLSDNLATTDAPVVERLRKAGAVLVGKTNLHEFAYGVVSPPTRNPWDIERIPGGSSGGSGAAVAAGMCIGSLGTDTAGSIRIPAAFCGLTGLRPRQETVSLEGIIPLSPSLDACGPIARTTGDAFLLHQAIAERPLGEIPPAGDLRLGVLADYPATAHADDDVAGAISAAVAALSASGVRTMEIDLPLFREWDRPRSFPLMLEALEVHRRAGWYPERAERYGPDVLESLRYAENLDPDRIEDGRVLLPRLIDRFHAAFDDADVLLLPITPTVATPVEEIGGYDGEHRPPIVRRLTRVCGPVNVCNLAALAVQCGLAGGLPVGMQFVARDEVTVLSLGLHYQTITEWHGLRPPRSGKRA